MNAEQDSVCEFCGGTGYYCKKCCGTKATCSCKFPIHQEACERCNEEVDDDELEA
jgi:hypothetical protein